METEIKLSLEATQAARLRRLPLLAGVPVSRRRLLSFYFDTPGFDLQRRRIALRVRRVGRVWVQTVKAEASLAGATSSRPEWEMRVQGAWPELDLLPIEAWQLFEDIDVAQLAEVFQTDFRRSAWQIELAGGRMELALDQGEVRAGETNWPISEVEIELLSGPASCLHTLALQLLEALPLRPEPRSKALRGYLLCGALRAKPVRVPAPDLRPDQRAGEAWRAGLAAALAQFVANLPGFLEQPQELEYLHLLRVAVRRLRSLAGLADSLGQPRPAWLDGLRALMARLNPARDWDVFLAEILPVAQQRLVDVPLDPDLMEALAETARQARQAAQLALADAATTRLVLQIEQSLLAAPPAAKDTATWAGEVLDRRWRNLRKEGSRYARLDAGERHALRLQAKKLRYAAEMFVPMAGRRGQTFMTAMAGLQDRLGLANDAVVARQLLAALAGEQPALAFEAGRLAGAVAAVAAEHSRADPRLGRSLKVKPFWRAPPADG